MTTLLQFAYETGDSSKGCQYWQDFVVVKSDTGIDLEGLEDGIAAYMESNSSEDKEYDEMTEEIMNAYFLGNWYFLDNCAISIDKTHTFWI